MYVSMFLLKCVAFWLVLNSYVTCQNNLKKEVGFNKELEEKVNALIKSAEEEKEKENNVDVAETVENVLNGVTEILVGIKQKDYFAVLLGITSTIDFIGTLFGIPALVTPIVKIIHSILSLAGAFKPAPVEDKFKSALKEKDIKDLQEKVLISIRTMKSRVLVNDLDQIFLETEKKRIKIHTRVKEYCGVDGEVDFGKCITLLELLSTYTNSQTMLATLSADTADLKKIQEKIKTYRKEDMNALRFLYNFENTKKIQQVILGELYRHPEKFVTVNYLKSLDKEFNLYERPSIYACNGEWLQGTCSVIKGNKAGSLTSLKSMFIPPQEEVKLAGKVKHNIVTGNEITSNGEVSIGPFKGMSVYSSGEKLKNKLTVRMTVGNSIDASNYVRVCRENGWCDTIPKQDGSLESINQIRWGKKKRMSSILVPEGMQVEYGTLKPKYALKTPIIIFGPHLVEGLEKCVSKDFHEYYMQITESGSTSVMKEQLKKEKGKIYYKKVKDIESQPGDMALLCSKKGGMGICLQQGKTSDSIESDLKNRQCQFTVKSINIPPSLCVRIKTDDYQEFTRTDMMMDLNYPYFTITKIYPAKSYGTSRCRLYRK